ncbi:MaoC family dehydratase N-terminal domain-containing protein [Allonocardiopsis opalescens]|uniref:UPF0336 protein CLV72_103563 n=1 Tax=Allonocardiopsis opalescens TaxID=1144618 RepID=A0A2T0Q883_9ACTN|nr:MaoC family dehydratase N-terminal domain-containing protein [Allonocardiopsis opalescens]PRX99953.1 acyl dehydratase [Allonocardiopsis opalescens]
MPINREFLGRSYPPSEPYQVSREKVAEFAAAIGDTNPLYLDPEAAKAAGHPDVLAPPTFPIVVAMRDSGTAVADPELGVDYSMVVHGRQSFAYSRPLYAGDVVTCTSTIAEIKAAGRNEVLTIDTAIGTTQGEHVVTASFTIVVRGGADS